MANTATLFSFLFVLLHCFCLLVVTAEEPKEGKIWFICVAGFDRYKYTYGFEAGVYRACSLLAGQSNEHLIIVSPNTAAYHRNNPLPGFVDHGFTSSNYYETIDITYNSKDMTSSLFYEILSGNSTAVKGIGGEKVLESGPRDTVVLVFINVGKYGLMTLTNDEYLLAEQFIPFVEYLKENEKFKKMLIIVDGHNAGSLFDDYLCKDCHILALTSTGREDDLELCHYDEDLDAFTSTCYMFFLLEYLEEIVNTEKYEKMTFFEFFQVVRTKTSFLGGVSNLYGHLELGNGKVSDYFGSAESMKEILTARKQQQQEQQQQSRDQTR